MDFPIKIKEGVVFVEGILGKVEQDHFILYLTTHESCPVADVVLTGSCTVFSLYQYTDADESKPFLPEEPSTLIEIPGGWEVGITTNKNKVCIVGVRSTLDLIQMPFSLM